jgi:RNA polymerase sigma-70 factor (ECF subfamily)
MYGRGATVFRAAETPAAVGRTCDQMGVAQLADPPGYPGRAAVPVTDDDLIALAVNGRADAFETLVERYERAVYHLAFRTLRETEEAKDATQEAWVKAYRALASFRPGAKFSTWIFTICYRVCCDRIAKRRRYSGDEIPDVADPAPGPEHQYEAAEEAARLRAAVERLPEKYRTVITLFHLQGKQYEEIAAVLGLPLGTVKTHLFRAKELLRTMLGEETMQRRTS